MGGHGFDPGPQHTRVIKNGTWHSDLRGRARTGRPSVRIMWLGVVSCQVSGAWTSLRQDYKSEHWAPCRNQTPSWYDWNFVESDIKPKQMAFLLTNSFLNAKMYQRQNWHEHNPIAFFSLCFCNISVCKLKRMMYIWWIIENESIRTDIIPQPLYNTIFGGFCFCSVLRKVSYVKNGAGCLGDNWFSDIDWIVTEHAVVLFRLPDRFLIIAF